MSELELLGPPEPHEIATGRYPVETLSEHDDDGTMVENVATLRESVVGRRIVSATKRPITTRYYGERNALVIELDNGTQVELMETSDCCAYTNLEAFLLRPDSVEHAITGVATTDEYTRWHIFADLGDIMALEVGWSCGNPFYYGYGFDIAVKPIIIDGEVIEQASLPAAPLALED